MAKSYSKFRFVVATREKAEDFATKTMTGRMLAFYNYPFVEVALYADNSTGLSTIYNLEIEKAKDNPAILVFAHDDIYLTDFYWPNQILNGLKQFDVLGVAGNKKWTPGQPSWAFKEIKDGKLVWDDKENLSGIVAHGDGFPPKNLSKYGPTGQAVELLDGLILIADSKKLIETGVRFDEQFDFHFYDLDFCRSARKAGLNLGTWALSVIHQSGGGFGSTVWSSAYRSFVSKKDIDFSAASRPDVSICCITYNHEKFIKNLINSFASQKTTVSFEIVIADDASTDSTVAMLNKEKAHHSLPIRIITQKKNIGYQRNLSGAIRMCKGKYIALCDGDDQWNDNHKIQKQYDFLEKNPDVVLSYGTVLAIKNGEIDKSYKGGSCHDLTSTQLIAAPPINTSTAFFRNIFKEVPPEFLTTGLSDLFIWSLLGHFGSGHFDPTITPGFYNIHSEGVFSTKTLSKKLSMHVMTSYSLHIYYRRTGNPNWAAHFLDLTKKLAISVLKVDPINGKSMIQAIPESMLSLAEQDFEFDKSTISHLIDEVLCK